MNPTRPFPRRIRASARNALELVRLGRFGERYSAPYDVVDQGDLHRLRRYATCDAPDAPPALLVPPLMVTSEVYDMAADVSAVQALGARAVQPFVLDFGAPEREAGGMRRTLDDHVRAVLKGIERVRTLTNRDVHVCGYSQGGMFAYQAAAYLRSKGVRSIVTFGSPVDIHRGLPALRSDITGALVRFVEPLVSSTLDRIDGLPGVLTSTAFKLLSPRKEIQQRADFVRLLHDRNALARREARRRFLGGEGFVAWPGPALRAFVEEFIVHNRMLSGGFVIDGQMVTVADITCPILCFIGGNDEIARPASVRAIASAAPDAPIDFVTVPAGHFGLVVGSRAMKITWPTVADWVHFHEGTGPRPAALESSAAQDEQAEPAEDGVAEDAELLVDTVTDTLRSAWHRLGDVTASAADAIDAVRYQEPRLRRLGRLAARDRVSPSLALAERAAASPDATFFLWRDRAFSYRDADNRVTNVARGLWASGVRPGARVGVAMGSRPSFLSMVTALGRIGAVAVVAPPDAPAAELRAAFAREGANKVASDPEFAAHVHAAVGHDVLVLGGGAEPRTLAQGLLDMETIDPAKVELPADVVDAGLARDLAMVLLRPSESGSLRAAPVTNHRWALSAWGAAAACTLKPNDTVYCCVPLHHPTGVLVSVGAAIAGGTRLAIAARFDPAHFVADVRRTGATVAFYAGDMLRPLLRQKPSRGDRSLPLRLFAGSGVRPSLAERLVERFGVGVMEFYASTTQKVIIANAAGNKPGAAGRLLPGSSPVVLVRCDLANHRAVRDERGMLIHASPGEPGLLAVRADADGEAPSLRDVGDFATGEQWYVSDAVLLQDGDGDFWFVDTLHGFVDTPGGPVSTRTVEDALYDLPEVVVAAVWDSASRLTAAFVSAEPVEAGRLTETFSRLPRHERPEVVVRLERMAMTDGFRPRKADLPGAVRGALATYRLAKDGLDYELTPASSDS